MKRPYHTVFPPARIVAPARIMLAITLGIGETWRICAEAAAGRMARMTGLDCRVITEITLPDTLPKLHPSWLKLLIPHLVPDVDDFLYFDSDILPMKPWDPAGIYESLGRPFCIVPDVNSAAVESECRMFGLPFPNGYLNCGLFMFGRHHTPVLDNAWQRGPVCGRWLEQTAVNLALNEMQVETARLPRTFNTLLWPGIDDYSPQALRNRPEVNLHAASLGGSAESLRQIQADAFAA